MSTNDEIAKAKAEWEASMVTPRIKKYGLDKSPARFYTPADQKDFDFKTKIGFPGEYPFTAGNEPFAFFQLNARKAALSGYRTSGASPVGSVGKYSGFGTPADTRDYHFKNQSQGQMGGPNVAFDLATQCGYDSDSDFAEGEVGRVGMALDTLEDFEILYEAFTGELNINKAPSAWTINAPAVVIIAMYVALAEKRGVPLEQLRGTPQNDILKEFVGRGTYIFPPRPSIRLFRDSLTFCTEHLPNLNVTSIGGYHMREAGASRAQDLAYSMANGQCYIQAGVDAGLHVDQFAPMITFNGFGGSMELYHEVAFQRAARRMWARMLKEEFGAKLKKSMLIRQSLAAHIGCSSTTLQRPINNLTRAVVGGIAGGMSGGMPNVFPPYDEPLGLGHSNEGMQMQIDASRILLYEAKLSEVTDPWAGSYFMESLTDEIEGEALAELERVKKAGGTLAAIESGYMARAIAKNAYEKQRKIETQEEFVVGVNCFTGDNELEVDIHSTVEPPYDPELMRTAEDRQKASLAKVKAKRDAKAVSSALAALRVSARDESVNVMPDVIKCVKVYASLQEICDVFRDEFGVAEPFRV